MEIKYESLVPWLNKTRELRAVGQHLLCADDPVRRRFGFVDEDSDLHYISLTHVQETAFQLTEKERNLIVKAEGRQALIAGVV